METTKKYTYEDWWDGTICLNTSVTICREQDEKFIKRVSWHEITEGDIDKIKEKQRELFFAKVTETLDKLMKHFQEGCQNSRLPELFFEKELVKVESFLYDIFPVEKIILFPEYGIKFDNFCLDNIQKYVKRHFIDGQIIEFDFMHSPNFLFKEEIPYQIYAETFWQYSKWLNPPEENLAPENNNTKNGESIPTNPNTKIFKNGYAYSFFSDLMEYTVNEKSVTADFSFIFHKLRNQNIEAINSNVTQPCFIDFVNQQTDFHIKANKLNFVEPKSKEKIYNLLLDKYKNDI